MRTKALILLNMLGIVNLGPLDPSKLSYHGPTYF